MKQHSERAHSKFSASGSERWLNCAASVDLEEQAPPQADSPWAKEGTLAHEILESVLKTDFDSLMKISETAPDDMLDHVFTVADRIHQVLKREGKLANMFAERKLFNREIHPEMFGTCDVTIYAPGTIHIMDFKYGQGHMVNPEENTQLLQYALAAAEEIKWDFDKAVMHILQPRSGSNWHKEWSVTKKELLNLWKPLFVKGVARVVKGGNKPFEGRWCHWCKAKTICPAKTEMKMQEITRIFNDNPIKETNGKEEKENQKNKKEENVEDFY